DPTAQRLTLVLGDLAPDFVEPAVPGDTHAGRRCLAPAQFRRDKGITRPVPKARDLSIFIFMGDAADGIGQRKGRIPADSHGLARLARIDTRILRLRKALERVGKLIIELRRRKITL